MLSSVGSGEGHRFVLDVSEWPVARFSSEGTGEISVDDMFERFDSCLAKAEPFVSLHDLRQMPHPSALNRRDFVAAVKDRAEPLERYLLGHAALVKNSLQQGVVTAVMWFLDLPFPVRVFTSEGDALVWLHDRFSRRDVAS